MTEHTILVAFTVEAEHRDLAHLHLMEKLPQVEASQWPGRPSKSTLTSWWVAEDDRQDGSDSDSAVFVSPGFTRRASIVLAAAGFTPALNVVPAGRNGWIEDPGCWPVS